jgi:hypothetical protein
LKPRVPHPDNKSFNQVSASPECLQAHEKDIVQAFDKLTQQFKEEEGRRRAINELRARRHEPPREPTDDEVAAAIATTPDFPVFKISKKNFNRQFCKCLSHREAGKCDCKLCAYIQWNTAAFHNARAKWDVAERCEEGTCSACTPGSAYREASRSPEHMMAFLLCPKCNPCDIQPNGFPPRAPAASTSSSAPASTVISTAQQRFSACDAEPIAAAPSPAAKATAVDADVDEVVRTRESRASTRKRQNESDPSLLFPSAAASTLTASPLAGAIGWPLLAYPAIEASVAGF